MNPAKAPHNRELGSGNGSRVTRAITNIKVNPAAWATATTRNTLVRLVAIPPEKSPPPQATAANKLNPDDSKVAIVIDYYDNLRTVCTVRTAAQSLSRKPMYRALNRHSRASARRSRAYKELSPQSGYRRTPADNTKQLILG